MTKWLTAFVLIATLCGSALAGLPLHAQEESCSMMGMMDCCAKAHASESTPMMMAARLCCAVNCPQTSPTIQTSSAFRFAPSIVIALDYTGGRPLIVAPVAPLRFNSAPISPPGAQPPYIRHQALLI